MSALGAIGTSDAVDVGPAPDGAGCWSTPVIAGLPANSAHRAPVQRTSLIATLIAAHGTPVVTLCAPTGFGKSTVLVQWAEADPRPFPWLTLNETHNDPDQLLRDLAVSTAVLRVAPTKRLRLLQEGIARPDGELPSTVETIVGAAIGPFVLVLDDAHLVTSRASLDVIGFLMLSMPAGSQLAIGCRAPLVHGTNALPVGRRHLEITAAELAFDLDEASSVLGFATDANTVRTTLDSCEGWPAVLDLYAVDGPVRSGRQQQERRRREQVVHRYLRAEILAELDESTLAFLTRTAVLDELRPGLCDTLFGSVDSGAILDRLRSRGLLVYLPNSRRVRHHYLLRRVLIEELELREPELIPQLHARASEWFAAGGEIDSAVQHAKLTGDSTRIGTLIWARIATSFEAGGAARLDSWLAGLTEEQIGQSHDLVITSALLARISGDAENAVRWRTLAQAREGRSWQSHLGESEHRGALAVLTAWHGVEENSDPLGLSSAAFDQLPADSPWRPSAGLLFGISLMLSGQQHQARGQLRCTEELAHALGQPGVRADCLAALGTLAFDDGDQQQSQLLIMRARMVLIENGLIDQPSSVFATSVVALGLARAGRSAEANRLVNIAIGHSEATTADGSWWHIHTRILQINACILAGEIATARRLTRQIHPLLRQARTRTSIFAGQQSSLALAEARLAALPADPDFGAQPFTLAEMRILHLLPTHLSFPEMGALLFVTRHTVKTQALGVYRKLGANSRHEAVLRACDLGYLPSMVVPDSLSAVETDRTIPVRSRM